MLQTVMLERANSGSTRDQKINLTPNCSCREVVAVLVICPKLGGMTPPCENTVTSSGSAKFGLLNRLNASALNCTLVCSVILFDFSSERSTERRFGPINAFRATFPNRPEGAITNAFALTK